jgi:predicted phage terminase large subunit-like protein
VAGRGRLYLIDLVRKKWTAPELKRRATAFWNRHAAEEPTKRGQLRTFYVEDKSSGTGLIQEFQDEGGIPVEGLERHVDKYTRVCDVLGYIEAGLVLLPEGAPWVHEFLTECEQFTADDSHEHDDQVDVLADAILVMLANSSENVWRGLGDGDE